MAKTDTPNISSDEEANSPESSESPPEENCSESSTVDPEVESILFWIDLISNVKDSELQTKVQKEFSAAIKKIFESKSHSSFSSLYRCVALIDPQGSINFNNADRIHRILSASSPKKDVLLILLSPGGIIEPAYQISKLCKRNSFNRFVVAIPREAKSAATLLALGADEINISPLGHLGPIDPQIGGLPALGVSQALKTIASVSQQYPGSAQMFASYLEKALTVEQIGYCERIGESAVQYAERLLATKQSLPSSQSEIAYELVYGYKDHGFVIDADEAREKLGAELVKNDPCVLSLAEDVYQLFSQVNSFLGFLKKKRMIIIGSFEKDVQVIDNSR